MNFLLNINKIKYNMDDSDVYRKKRALELGLLETASYADIIDHHSYTYDNTNDNTNKKFI